jgi:hypothetical protein
MPTKSDLAKWLTFTGFFIVSSNFFAVLKFVVPSEASDIVPSTTGPMRIAPLHHYSNYHKYQMVATPYAQTY